MKKILAVLLSMAMVVCMMPTAVFAAGETPASKIDLENATITLSATAAVYNGKVQTPTITVKDAAGKEAKLDTDYTIKWVKGDLAKKDDFTSATEASELKDAGTYSVLISAKTDSAVLQGEPVIKQFKIDKYDLSKVIILVADQIAAPSGNTLAAGSLSYYYEGRTMPAADVTNIFDPNLKVTLTGDATKGYTASFTMDKANGDADNFSGAIPSTGFKVVKNISDCIVKSVNGTEVLSVISGGAYDNTNKNVAGLFSLYDGDTKLTYGTDYTVSTDDAKTAGEHAVTIKGIGKYGSTKPATLKIDPRNANTYVRADAIPDQTFASQTSVEPVLKDTTLNKVLEQGKDYVVTPPSAVAAGNKNSVKVTFIGNYTGADLDISFNVVANDKNVAGTGIAVSYNGKDISNGGLIVTGGMYNGASQPLYGISVYTVDGTKRTDLSSNYYTISYEYFDSKGKTVATTSPVDAKTYSVYLVGRNGYAGKRLLGTYTIQKYNMSYVDVNVYMANAVATPTVTVKSKYENITFTKDKDFTFTHWVNTSKGTVTVSVTAVVDGNLTGSTTVTSPITAKSITSCSASFVNNRNSAIYTGYVITPDVIVRDGYTTLTKGTHYKVVYKNAAGKTVSAIKDAGTYTVEIQGMGAYVGTLTLYFTVTGNDISNYTVTLKENSVNATGMIQIPRIDSVKSGNKVLATSNYTVSYQDATGKTVSIIKDPGTYKVVVTGKGAYSGSTYATYRVVGLTQTITIGKDSYKAYPTTDDFDLNAKSDYALSKLTYTSSNPAVASVSANGTVTINKVGRAVITINASQVGKYEAASKSVIIKVYPKKTVITRSLWTGGNAKQFKVRWNYQDGATKYQIRYSRYSDFNKYSTKNVASRGNNNYATQTNTVKKLRSNTKYFVKVRAIYVDEESGAVYYGRWSSVRSIKTK